MIDTLERIHTIPNDINSIFAEVTIDSRRNHAILIGNNHSDKRTVVFYDEIDNLIEALELLKDKYFK